MRAALITMQWAILGVCFLAYLFMWLVWGVGGLELLRDLGATAIPALGFFIFASVVVMLVGAFAFLVELRAFLRNPLLYLRAFLRRIMD